MCAALLFRVVPFRAACYCVAMRCASCWVSICGAQYFHVKCRQHIHNAPESTGEKGKEMG